MKNNLFHSRRLVLIPLMLLFATSVSSQTSVQNELIDSEILEAVFRYQIKQCAENTTLTSFLLSVRGVDPAEEFMKRFADEAVSVKKKSDMAQTEQTHEYIDKESGKFVALLSVDKLKSLEENRAEVLGSCGYADWAARGYRYELVKEKKRWVVKRSDSTWVW